ncbi:BLOC-3 complex member HPS4 isoform X2 [Lepisosteus oculatus]|uniref:BLOC-3 complex member HPS4 isoform X2 n=1 Tax=Lepisosteus oculatus TaxID=7918 RepID=UPI0035F5107A
MADIAAAQSQWCSVFFLYDGSKVKEEGDPTRAGICYFYPEETELDQQEVLCGQIAGVCRCLSDISHAPPRLLRLRRRKFAVCLLGDFLWALGCAGEIPDVSLCQYLDQLIGQFCFYNGPVRQSYQERPREELAVQWAQYLAQLQGGSTELQQVFTSLHTIDCTQIDPLLLLKAALILQACQRCPLVLAGCILYRGRVVSTQMPPELTGKVMVRDSSSEAQDSPLPADGDPLQRHVSTVPVFLTADELALLRHPPVDWVCRSHPTPQLASHGRKSRLLSRTLSDTLEPELDLCLSQPCGHADHTPTSDSAPSSGGASSPSHTGAAHPSLSGSFLSAGRREDSPDREQASRHTPDPQSGVAEGGGNGRGSRAELVPMRLYLHRVRDLALALLVELQFDTDAAATEDVYCSSLASLNGLEAHLREMGGAAPGPQGPYCFAHYDRVQNTLSTNAAVPQDCSFVRAAALLHAHFSQTPTLQEAIIRSAGTAVYGTRSAAQETLFQQQGVAVRNSGIPNPQDSAFTLPSKARHRLLKHGVNLL